MAQNWWLRKSIDLDLDRDGILHPIEKSHVSGKKIQFQIKKKLIPQICSWLDIKLD